jgi:hypothetical protein
MFGSRIDHHRLRSHLGAGGGQRAAFALPPLLRLRLGGVPLVGTARLAQCVQGAGGQRQHGHGKQSDRHRVTSPSKRGTDRAPAKPQRTLWSQHGKHRARCHTICSGRTQRSKS